MVAALLHLPVQSGLNEYMITLLYCAVFTVIGYLHGRDGNGG